MRCGMLTFTVSAEQDDPHSGVCEPHDLLAQSGDINLLIVGHWRDERCVHPILEFPGSSAIRRTVGLSSHVE